MCLITNRCKIYWWEEELLLIHFNKQRIKSFKELINEYLILDKNPLENIRNTNSLIYVIKNGYVYDAENLDKIYPEMESAKYPWTQSSPNKNLPGVGKN